MIVTEFMANGSLDTFLRVSILVICLILYTNLSAKFGKDMLRLYTNSSASLKMINCIYTHSQVFCLFDLILYVPSTIFQL